MDIREQYREQNREFQLACERACKIFSDEIIKRFLSPLMCDIINQQEFSTQYQELLKQGGRKS